MITLGIKGQIESMLFNSSKLMAFTIIMVYVLNGNDLTSEIVVKVLSWSELLKTVSWFLSMGAQFGTEMFMSVGRIQVGYSNWFKYGTIKYFVQALIRMFRVK